MAAVGSDTVVVSDPLVVRDIVRGGSGGIARDRWKSF